MNCKRCNIEISKTGSIAGYCYPCGDIVLAEHEGVKAELEKAQADNAAFMDGLALIAGHGINNMLKWCIKNNCHSGAGYEKSDALRQRIAQHLISNPHPGADLLKELEQLREKNAEYKDIAGLSCEEYRMHRATIEQYKRALELAATGTAKELCITDLQGIDEAPDYCQNNPSEDACIKCWSKLFLAKAKEGDAP